MYDLSYAIPSLLLVLLFVVYYYSLPRIPNRMNYCFWMLLTVEFSTISFSILSSWIDNNYLDFPVAVVYLVNIAFFILFYLRPYAFFAFTLSVIKKEEYYSKGFTVLKSIPLLFCILLALSTPVTGVIFTIDEAGYHSGPYYNVLYVEFLFYVIISGLITYMNREAQQQKRDKLSIIWCNIMLLTGMFFRFYFPKVLLMNTFCLIVVAILYLSFENPDFYLERRTQIFNDKALRQYLEEINGKKGYRIFAFVIHNYHDNRELYGASQMDVGLYNVSKYLRRAFPDLLAFYYRDGRFVLVGNEELDKEYEQIQQTLEKRFASSIIANDAELYLRISSVYINPQKKPSTYNTILNVLGKALEEISTDSGENFVVIDEEFIRNIENDTDVKRALEQAIEQEKVEAFLQPIVDAKTGKVVGAEALARIRNSNGDIIPPGKFVPIAEKTGKISYVGERVFDEVCRFINNGDMEKTGLSWINVNLSPIQFMRQDLDAKLSSIVISKGIDPQLIHLEVTEETMIDEALLLKQLKTISKKGFQFILDDFGKGYSNLSRLKKCPFINVKIDMSVVWEYLSKPDDMLPSMVSTFKKLGFGVTAEGVETEKMAKEMRDIGCDYLQGYYYGKAIPMDEFVNRYS